jgi:hypothetical protein
MDTLPIGAQWPKHPYRGLNFYREADALLFRERDKDVEECAAILLGFGVKILLLQGSSGSGKSSFLRAGLIPHLKRDKRRNFFLSGGDSVIRCTFDPLPEIAWSLVDTLENSGSAVEMAYDGGEWGGEALGNAAVSEEVRRKIEQALPGPREKLAEVLVEGLVEICGELPGKLVLVLDQAEEVLTLTPGGPVGNEAAAAFFRFLEDVYLRNVDARLIVALRTEYYGRFRDELRISDDRLGKRPRSGGVEPYLLRPLREKNALLRIIDAPTLAEREDGTPIYNFAFEKGLAEQIVDDLLKTFEYGSVTPALQMVCSSLHERLTEENRTITHAEYTKLGRTNGITDNYLVRGIHASGARTKAERDQWRELLHSLVSRQGGGTLVSLIQPLEELEKEAHDLGIRGDIRPVLVKLTRGAAPLLRGEPPEAPQNFSLKHDVLAVGLARLHVAHREVVKANEKAQRWVLAAGLAALLVGIIVGSTLWQRAADVFEANAKVIDVRNEHAINAFEGNFRRSLLLTLANLDATAAPDDLYERFTGGVEQKHRKMLGELRKVLFRAPSFAGHYQAAGFDPAGSRVALLRQGEGELRILNLRLGDSEQAEPETYDLPAPALQSSMLRPAVGFVRGLGPAALVNDHVYFWDDQRVRHECEIFPILPSIFRFGTWIRAEFIAGRLQLSVAERQVLSIERQGRTSSLRVLRLDAADLRDCLSSIASRDPLRIPERVGSPPVPAFSDADGLPQRYDYLEETSGPAPNELAPNLPPDPSRIGPGKLVELDAVIGSADQQDAPIRIAVGQVAPERWIPERVHFTLAFAANAEATVFKFDGPDFYVYDLANRRSSNRRDYVAIPAQHVVVASDLPREAWRLQPSRIPSVYPPFAAAKVGQHWRAAWLAPNGVWAVESSDRDPGTAELVFGVEAPLIGEPDGAKLQFTRDGEFLVLQRVHFPSQVFMRIWDLRPSWRTWVEDPNTTEQDLRAAACRIVRMEEGDGAFDEMASKLFQIDAAHREPCPKP